LQEAREIVPEAFSADEHPLNLIGGEWTSPGRGKLFLSPVDGTPLGRLPMIDLETGKRAVSLSAREFADWSRVDLDERRRRVAACIAELREHRELLACLLVWEIGKPFRQSLTSVDRCLDGVDWYVKHIESMLEGRRPIELVSNVASWNYPLSVLTHAVLVQAMAGNSVISKTPSDGGLFALTLAMGVARRHGLPMSLVSGSGGHLGEALVRSDEVAGLSFVGGTSHGREIAASLFERTSAT
jgi:acyl-CoA reductase-like NAD-dependent aldehyde dehydrogenase